jgi:apolipoprotein N-acyltransferase
VSVRRGGITLPSLAAGLALALSLPPWGWWPLAFLGAGLLFWRLEGLRPRTRLLAGWLAGLGCFVPALWWAQSFNWYGALALMAVEALSMGVAAVLVPPRRGRLVAFVGAFTLLEAVRMTWPFGGLPIGGVYLGQAGGPLLGTARLGGPLLLTALVWAGGAALSVLVRSAWVRLRPSVTGGTGGPAPRPGPAAALLVLAAMTVLVVAGDHAPDGGNAIRLLPVAAVQGGGRRGLSGTRSDPASVFAAQVAATDGLGARPAGRRPELVVWPENVIRLPGPLRGSAQAVVMSRLARRLGATVVAGVTSVVSATTFRNEVVAWGPDGRIVDSFEKVHRVPFGEYVPFRGFFSHFASLSGVPRDAISGNGSGLLRTPAAPLGVLVSFELFYADRGRASVRQGAQLLVVPTNTSSYATSQIPAQSIAADQVQAVQLGRDLVQASPTGYSAVVDDRGRVRQRSVLGHRQVLLATVALRDGSTLYTRWGDVPVVVLASAALMAGWLLGRARRSS